MATKIDKIKYAGMFGPTVGDKVRLGDTELFIEIEKDFTVYGDENKFGGGKTVRDGMSQSSTATRDQGVLDFVITNVMIIDHWGIVKGDIGIRDGKIVGIGKAGNPDTQEGVHPNLIIGASTEVHGGQGLIAIQTSARNGDVVGAVLVNDNDEIMLITDGGTLVRTRVDGISVVGRNTQGVTIIRLDKKKK